MNAGAAAAVLSCAMNTLLRSLHAGVRLLRSSPGVALTAIGTLAMGIGFTTTMFGIVQRS